MNVFDGIFVMRVSVIFLIFVICFLMMNFYVLMLKILYVILRWMRGLMFVVLKVLFMFFCVILGVFFDCFGKVGMMEF